MPNYHHQQQEYSQLEPQRGQNRWTRGGGANRNQGEGGGRSWRDRDDQYYSAQGNDERIPDQSNHLQDSSNSSFATGHYNPNHTQSYRQNDTTSHYNEQYPQNHQYHYSDAYSRTQPDFPSNDYPHNDYSVASQSHFESQYPPTSQYDPSFPASPSSFPLSPFSQPFHSTLPVHQPYDNNRWRGQGSSRRGGGQYTSNWRGGAGGRHGDRYVSERDQAEASLWSTGDYRPLPPPPPPNRQTSRSPSPVPHSYNSPTRREKLHKRQGPVPTPSPAYVAAVSSSSSPSSTKQEPVLLILDLNHTLLCRSERNRAGSKVPLVRPYLSSFLEYICLSPSLTSPASPRYLPIIFSSARYRNVLSLLVALNIVPASKLPPFKPYDPRAPLQTYKVSKEDGDVVELVWTRENMGLSDRDFKGDVETCKDLEGVWKEFGLGGLGDGASEEERNREGAARTILLDDEPSKAAQQPHSLLPIKPFILQPSDFPPLPIFQPKSATDLPPPPSAVELSPTHPLMIGSEEVIEDKSLLSTVYLLDRMTSLPSTNLAKEIKDGRWEAIRKEVRTELGDQNLSEEEVEREMERRGEEILKREGIECRKEWDKGWRERVLENKNERVKK